MKALVLFIGLSVSLAGFSQSHVIETSGATVSFKYVDEDTKGTLSDVSASINLNYSDLPNSTVKGSVSVATLSTQNKTRDKHLKSPDFFDAEKYPEIKFEATSIEKKDKYYVAKGKLTIKETTKEVGFRIKEENGMLVFKTTIYSADYGVAVKKGRDRSKVYVSVKIPLK